MLVEREAVSGQIEPDVGLALAEQAAQRGHHASGQNRPGAPARRILVVEDEAPILRQLRRILVANGYQVLTAAGGRQALELARQQAPDLVLLDLCIPGIDGLAVCQELRQWSATPIIVVSALGEEHFKVRALDLGADDYLTKPFGYDELLARVRVCLRRSAGGVKEVVGGSQTVLASGDGYLRLDVSTHKVLAGAREVRLSPKEFELLAHLMRAPDRVVTHHALLKLIWGPEFADQFDYLRVYMRQLRRKVEQNPTYPRYLVTEPGVGYVFRTS